MKFQTILLAAASAVIISLPAEAAVLASYDFASNLAATTSAANMTAGSFTFATGFTTNTGYSSGGNIFARVNATTGSTLAAAITANNYVTVTVTPDPGFQLNLTSLTVDLGYSLNAASVPSGVGVSLSTSVFSSVGGFTAPAVLATQTFTAADQGTTGILYQNINIDLTDPAYQGLSGPLQFRIYFYDSNSSLTQPIHRVDNFTLNGAVVPEPSATLLGGLGMLALLRRRRQG